MMSGSPDGLRFRRFGRLPEDLELDFEQSSRPHLVTRLLWSCARDGHGERPDPVALQALSVGARVAYLLRVAARGGATSFAVPLLCRSPSCLQQLEVELSIEEIMDPPGTAQQEAALAVRVGETELVLRRPTGNDQLQWQRQAFGDARTARDTMIRALLNESSEPLTEWPIPDDFAEAIGEAMQAFDPLVNYTLGVRCPYCEEEHPYEIDLEDLVLDHLQRAQHDLLDAIHRLALGYHWSESQILALSPRRRTRYLALIDGEGQR